MDVGIAVIGLGRWGPNHIRNFHSLANCAVVAAADPSEKTWRRAQAAHNAIKCYTSYREVLQRDDVHAVVIATPTETHAEIATAALEAGKHVLCEKPLARSSAAAWKLVELAAQRQRVLMCGHVFLFNPGIQFLARTVREKTVGKVYYLSAIRTNLGPFRSDVNAAWDLASHDIYILNAILGERPQAVSAVGRSYLRKPVEDIVFLTLEYPDGVLGHVHVSWLDPKKVRQITLVGEHKMVTWDDQGSPGPIMIYDRSVIRDPTYETYGEFQLLTREGDVVLPRIPPKEPLAIQAESFVTRCTGAAKEADAKAASGREGAEVVDVLEAVSQSLARNGASIQVQYGG